MSDELLNLRNRIDSLDEEILARLSERATCAQRVGEIKHGNIYRAEREAQVLRRLADINPGPLPGGAVERIKGSKLKELVITSSIQPTAAVEAAPNIRVISIADLMGEAISRTASEQSVSTLFD